MGPIERHAHDPVPAFDAERLHPSSSVARHDRAGGHRAGARAGGRYGTGVGYNPFRKQVHRRADSLIVVLTVAVVLGLVLWAALPR